MGWTGMFNWLSSEKNSEILKRELFSSIEKKYEPLKWSDKGGHTWCLYKNNETNKVYAAVILCQRCTKDHEFLYKEIGLSSGPYHYDMPASWIPLIKDTYKDEEYAQNWFKEREKYLSEKKEDKFGIGNILKVHNGRGRIVWSDGFKIEENSDFFIWVSPHQTHSRVTKLFTIAHQGDDGEFRKSYHRIDNKLMKNLSCEIVRRAK